MTVAFLIDLATDYGVLLVIALGLHVIMLSGQASMGQAGIAGIGAYLAAIMSVKLGFNFYLTLFLAMMGGAVVGVGISYLMALRLKGMYLAIGTFALGEAVITIAININYIGGAIGFPGIPFLTTLPVVAVIVAVLLLLLHRFERSRLGLSFRAVRDSDVVAGTVGVNVHLMKTLAWTIGCAITALGGALHAHRIGIVAPSEFTFLFSVQILLAPILGGTHRFWGTVVGAFIVYFIPWLVYVLQPEDRLMLYGALLMLIMAYRPQGLLGKKTAR